MISFCTTCRNRLWQLKQTLAHNLSHLGKNEISLVDYGSTDGMAGWVWANFRGDIEAGRLRFFEVKNPVMWSSPRSKNLAHRLARGDYLFNLDADNWIDAEVVKMVQAARGMSVPCHQSKVFGDGSFGRIGLPRKLFDEIGGYDENLLPMGSQDMNLLERMKKLKIRLAHLPVTQRPAVENTYIDKMAEAGGKETKDQNAAGQEFIDMTHLNLQFSRVRVRYEGPRLKGGFASYRGLLNGDPVTIDGFNVIRPDDPAGW